MRTVQRKAYEHRWRKENLDMVGGVPWKTSPDGGEEEAIMPALDIGMEMPEMEILSVPTEDQRPIPRRLYSKARDIERHSATAIVAWRLYGGKGGYLTPRRAESG